MDLAIRYNPPFNFDLGSDQHMKRTYQPNKRHKQTTHGFRVRMRTTDGQNVLKRRRLKGRARLAW